MYSVSHTSTLCKSVERKEEQGVCTQRGEERRYFRSRSQNRPVTMHDPKQSDVPLSSPMLLTTGASISRVLLSIANIGPSAISTAPTRATCTSSSLRMSKRSVLAAAASSWPSAIHPTKPRTNGSSDDRGISS